MNCTVIRKALLLSLVLVQNIFAAVGDNGTWTAFGGVGEGCTGAIWAAATAANGDLYVGGYFAACGDAPAANIARWDGSTWSPLGTGVDGQAMTIAVSDTGVYVGGDFSHAGDVAANGLAYWDGAAWHALGSAADQFIVGAMAISGTDVYVAGTLTIGGVTVNGVERWDTLAQAWSVVGTLDNGGYVIALAVANGTLYAGGQFSGINGVTVANIAAWDGSSWSALGSGVDAPVGPILGGSTPMVASGGLLYVSGQFTHAGGVSANRIAVWNGSGWLALGSGVNSHVLSLTVGPDGIYAGGRFTQAGGLAVNYIARWDGSAWYAVGGGLTRDSSSYVVRALAASGSKVYAGGGFSCASGCAVKAHFVAAWGGSTWSALGTPGGNGLHNDVVAAAAYAGGACVGTFWEGYSGLGKLACWDGSAWGGLGGNPANDIPQYVLAMTAAGSDLYIGGYLSLSGGCCIGRWDGAAWNALGSGVDDEVDSIAVSGTDIYVSGVFANAGGQAANGIAQWDGTSWHALGSGVYAVRALAVYGGKLYAGGGFPNAGGNPIPYLAVWDGATWSAVGGGVDGQVNALLVVGNQLYVGGNFANAGGNAVNGIASWNGSTWSPLATGVAYGGGSGSVSSLASSGSTLYVGGTFDHAGGVPASSIARWDGATFTSFGSGSAEGVGPYGIVLALAVNGADVYVGGHFGTAGGQLSASIARYTPDQIFSNGSFE